MHHLIRTSFSVIFQAQIRQKNEVIDDIQEITVRLRTLNLSSYEFASLEAIVLFKPGKLCFIWKRYNVMFNFCLFVCLSVYSN